MKTLPPIPTGDMPQTDTHDTARRQKLGLSCEKQMIEYIAAQSGDQQRRAQLGLDAHESQPSTPLAIYAAFALGAIIGAAVIVIGISI